MVFFLSYLVAWCNATYAANWLLLQGTENLKKTKPARLWGFIQPEFQQTKGTILGADPFKGQKAAFNQIRPDLKSKSSFNIIRARIGIRGTPLKEDPKINYFLLAEFGHNGLTNKDGGSARLTDASVTFNHVKGARLRVGQFKLPGSEEGYQAIHAFNYVNFSNFVGQQLLERFFDGNGSGSSANLFNGPVGAFRDTGIQVFETIKIAAWEHSYAVMYGTGNGGGDNHDLYLYGSSEKVVGGRGPKREGFKFFIWRQKGT